VFPGVEHRLAVVGVAFARVGLSLALVGDEVALLGVPVGLAQSALPRSSTPRFPPGRGSHPPPAPGISRPWTPWTPRYEVRGRSDHAGDAGRVGRRDRRARLAVRPRGPPPV